MLPFWQFVSGFSGWLELLTGAAEEAMRLRADNPVGDDLWVLEWVLRTVRVKSVLSGVEGYRPWLWRLWRLWLELLDM